MMKYSLAVAIAAFVPACAAPTNGQPDTPINRVSDGLRRTADYVQEVPVPNPSNPLDLLLYGAGALAALTGTGVATYKKVNKDRDSRRKERNEAV